MSATTATTAADPAGAAHDGELGLWAGAWRQRDYWGTVFLRTWRASIFSAFAAPLLYVVAMGVVLGGFIARSPSQLEGADSYLAFVVPGLIASHAMQGAVQETTYPVMGMLKWHKTYYSMVATPLAVPHLVLGHLLFVLARIVATCTVFTLVMAPFGVFETWWGAVLGLLVQVLTGLTFATLVYGVAARTHNEAAFGVLFRLVVFPLFLFSGAFFPVSNLGSVGAAIARCTPLWQGVNLSRMLALDHVIWWEAGVNLAVLLALCAVGWRWSVTGLTKRMEQ